MNSEPKDDLSIKALTDITVFADLIEFKGGWKSFYACHRELADFITKGVKDNEAKKSRLVLMPRGHLKSTICSVLYVLWRIYRNPDYRGLVVCNNKHLSFSFIRELRAYLENTDLQVKVWNNRPHIVGNLIPALDKRNRQRNMSSEFDTDAEDRKVVWTANALQVIRQGTFKEPTVYAASVGSPITGFHFDEAIADDVIDFNNVKPPRCDSVKQWLEDLNSVLNPIVKFDFGLFVDYLGQQELFVGTRYGLFDFYGSILDDEEQMGFDCLVKSIYKDFDNPDEYLCPELFNKALEVKIRRKMSERHFSCQYLNKVFVNDFAVLDADKAKFFPSAAFFTDIDGNQWLKSAAFDRNIPVSPVIVIDPAFTKDDCAVLVGAKVNDVLYVIDGTVEVMNPTALVKTVVSLAKKYRIRRVFAEQNGVGALLPSLFFPLNDKNSVDGQPIIVVQHWESRPKQEKIEGVLQPLFYNSTIWFNEQFKTKPCWRQLFEFPSNHKDDFLDALVILAEKATNKQIRSSNKMPEIKRFSLGFESLPTTPDKTDSYLGQYNDYIL